jgi:hypothetical protein
MTMFHDLVDMIGNSVSTIVARLERELGRNTFQTNLA